MPYSPYKSGPVSMTVAIIVAVVAVVVGIVMLSRHKEGLGALFIVAGVVAAVLAMVARPR